MLEFFYKENESEEEKSSDDSIIKNKSALNPPRNRDKILDQNIDSLNSLNFPNLQKAPKSNLSKLEWAAINNLKNDKNIEIKEADKGGSVVILSKSHYKSMTLSQLNDEKTYTKLNSNPYQAIMKKIKALITKYKPLLTDSEYKYLSHSYFETSNFYGHPKIHKSEILHKAIKEQNKELITILEPKDLKLRPIVGRPKCPTRSLSNFLDLILKPLTKHVKSNIKDNIEFLKTCKRNVTDDTVLVTFDVCSLYTNIPHEFGLRAIEYFVSNNRQSINPRFTKQFVLEAASFMLSNNSMTFDEMFYLQIQGIVMGTIFAPTYATLSMGFHEIELYAIIRNKITLSVSNYFEQNWKRFLDDCFIFLRLSLIKPYELLDVLNNINPAVQFTMETSDTQLPFLDVMINKEGKKVFMDIYSKPNDSKRYVSFKSNHPKHCLKNIPFFLARRICMISEKDSLKEIKLKELETLLLEQHYPERIIKTGINKALKIPKNELRNVKEQEKKKILPFISTFNPNNPKALPIIKQTLENLKTLDRMRNALKKVKFITCKRQAPNLERILCKSSFSPSNSI